MRLNNAVILFLTVSFIFFTTVAFARTWTVNDSGGADFTDIQPAIDAASAGDTIKVAEGRYINANTTVIDRKSSIFLCGGWSEDFSQYDPDHYISYVENVNTVKGTTFSITWCDFVEIQGFEIHLTSGAPELPHANIYASDNRKVVIRRNKLYMSLAANYTNTILIHAPNFLNEAVVDSNISIDTQRHQNTYQPHFVAGAIIQGRIHAEFRYNEIHARDGIGIVLQTVPESRVHTYASGVIENNLVRCYGTGWGLAASAPVDSVEVTIRNNVVINSGYLAIEATTPNQGGHIAAFIYNNTVDSVFVSWASDPMGIYANNLSATSTVDFRNNLVMNADRAIAWTGQGSVTAEYNTLYNNRVNAYNLSLNATHLFTDPILTKCNDIGNPFEDISYCLNENSPCIDAGDPSPSYTDADGTRNDTGAIYYRHPATPPVVWKVNDNGGVDFSTLQAAIDAASNGDTIKVAEGFYSTEWHTGYIDGKQNIHLIGGWTNDFKNFDPQNYPTILKSEDVHVISIINSSDISVEGFDIIADGVNEQSSGVAIANSDRIQIQHNRVQLTNKASLGTAISIVSWGANTASAIVQENILINPKTTSTFGQRLLQIFSGNSGSTRAMIQRNVIIGNQEIGLFFFSTADSYNSCYAEVLNNTIVSSGVGISAWSSSYTQMDTLILKNNIILDCRDGIVKGTEFAYFSAEHNNSFNNNSNFMNFEPTGSNISFDPQFVSCLNKSFPFENKPYCLSSISPCIDAGDPNPKYNDPDGTQNDMGAIYHHRAGIPRTWKVNDSGGANFTDIQAAIDTAATGDTIKVAAGNYMIQIPISIQKKSNIYISGGWAENFSQQNSTQFVSRIQNTNATDGSVFLIVNSNSIQLEGFEIHVTNGSYLAADGINIKDCLDFVLRQNTIYVETAAILARGIIVASDVTAASGVVEHCTINDTQTNRVNQQLLVGYANTFGNLDITFRRNKVYVRDSEAITLYAERTVGSEHPKINGLIEENYIVGYDEWWANGIIANATDNCSITTTIQRNIVKTVEGQGITVTSNGSGILNCLVQNNTIDHATSHGIYASADSPAASIFIKNNIVVNSNFGIRQVKGHVSIQYNNCFASSSKNYEGFTPDVTNISNDPQFIICQNQSFLFENLPYCLSGTSPCIGTGDPDPQFNDPDGTQNDMGAIYYHRTRTPGVLTVNDDGGADFSDIQAAINAAQPGDTIKVAGGMYTNDSGYSLWSKDNIIILGGWSDDFWQRNTIQHVSLLESSPSATSTIFILFSGCSNAKFDGFKVHVIHENCTGISILSGPEVTSVTISNNDVTTTTSGSGINVWAGLSQRVSATIEDNTVSAIEVSNTYSTNISVSAGLGGVLENIIVRRNKVDNKNTNGIVFYGYVDSLKTTRISGIIEENYINCNGKGSRGISVGTNFTDVSLDVTICKNIIENSQWAGVIVWSDHAIKSFRCKVLNNTVKQIDDDDTNTAGVYIDFRESMSASLEIRNNVMINGGYGIQAQAIPSGINIRFNNAFGNRHQNYFASNYTFDNTNLQINPQFTSCTNQNFPFENLPYCLSATSPCKNTGDPDPQYNDPDGTRNDIGALYFHQTRGLAPIAVIDAITPAPATIFDVIHLRGHGYDPDHLNDPQAITAYRWALKVNDAVYQIAASADTTLRANYPFQSGYNVLQFQVQDQDGLWSTAAEQTLYIFGPSRAIICAGHRNLSGSWQSDALWPLTDQVTTHAYRVLDEGIHPDTTQSKANIYFLHPDIQRPQTDATSTLENLRQAITNWAPTQGVGPGIPLLIYLTGHGGSDYFEVNGAYERLSADTLNVWLNDLQQRTGCDQVMVIADFCYSGTFLDNLRTAARREQSTQQRVVISSTGSQVAHFLSGTSFSQVFFNQMAGGQKRMIGDAFAAAKDEMAKNSLFGNQIPLLDDDGNGQDNPPEQARRVPVIVYIDAGEPPKLILRMADRELPRPGLPDTLLMDVSSPHKDLAYVGVSIVPPNIVIPDKTEQFQTPILQLETLPLQNIGEISPRLYRYRLIYNKLNQCGMYTFNVFAYDTDGNYALSVTHKVKVAAGLGDVNFDCRTNLADALLILQHILKLNTLTAAQQANADVNRDGTVDIRDVLGLLNR